MTLPINEPRCLAHPPDDGVTHRFDWCERRETCARALAISAKKFEMDAIYKNRVCKPGEYDQFIEAQP